MPRRKIFPLLPELFFLISDFGPYSSCFLNLKCLSLPNPAEEFLFVSKASVKTTFLQGTLLRVLHLLTPNEAYIFYNYLSLSVVSHNIQVIYSVFFLMSYSPTEPQRVNWNVSNNFWIELIVLRKSFCCSYVNR